MKIVTWHKDSYGLFDYETKNITVSMNLIENSIAIYKDGSEIFIISLENDLQSPYNEYLFSIVKNHIGSSHSNTTKFHLLTDNAKRLIKHSEELSKANYPFVVIRTLKHLNDDPKGYSLEVGDLVKIGHVQYKVLEYNDKNPMNFVSLLADLNTILKLNNVPFDLLVKEVNEDIINIPKYECRICYSGVDTANPKNILINPCNCKGRNEYVHVNPNNFFKIQGRPLGCDQLEQAWVINQREDRLRSVFYLFFIVNCLREIITRKLLKKANANMITYHWKKFICDLCKGPLPHIIKHNTDIIHGLIPIYRQQNKPYLILERIFHDYSNSENSPDEVHSKTFIQLILNDLDQAIKIGRGHDCDLVESDITVSRLHAFIRNQNGKFTIYDNNSKFSTLVSLRRSFDIESKKLGIQLGRTVMTFSLKGPILPIMNFIREPKNLTKTTKGTTGLITGAMPLSLSSPLIQEIPSNVPKEEIKYKINVPSDEDINSLYHSSSNSSRSSSHSRDNRSRSISRNRSNSSIRTNYGNVEIVNSYEENYNNDRGQIN